jgi:hypothetical protein
VREAGRSTQGVRLIHLGENESLAGLEKILDPDDAANGQLANGDLPAAEAPDDTPQGDAPEGGEPA